MEKHFDKNDVEYFKQLLNHEDNVIRTRAICILAEIGDGRVVDAISDTLENDRDSLVRHEAAFALGQLGFTDALNALSHVINSDPQLVREARSRHCNGCDRLGARKRPARARTIR